MMQQTKYFLCSKFEKIQAQLKLKQKYRLMAYGISRYIGQHYVTFIVMVVAYCIIIKPIHQFYVTKIQRQVYSVPVNLTSISPIIGFYSNFSNYLKVKNVRQILQINCQLDCFIAQTISSFQGFHITYKRYLYQPGDSSFQYTDWVNFNNAFIKASQLQHALASIKQKIAVGISFQFQLNQYHQFNKQDLYSIRRVMEKNGFKYNIKQSFTLRRAQSKVINIFTRETNAISNLFSGLSNYFAIQAQVNLKTDLPFLKQWIGHHYLLGFDKFFIYLIDYQNDNRQGCVQASSQILMEQLQKIIKNYENKIVLIPWQPKPVYIPFPFSLMYDSVPKSQHDFIYNFARAVKYSIFLKMNEIIFSQTDAKIYHQVQGLEASGHDKFKFQVKFFVDRFCSNQKYLQFNTKYLHMSSKNIHHLELFRTQNYVFGWWPWQNYAKSSKTYDFSRSMFRINSYSVDSQKLQQLKQQTGLKNIKFGVDNSGRLRSKIIRQICFQSCYFTLSENCLNFNNIKCL